MLSDSQIMFKRPWTEPKSELVICLREEYLGFSDLQIFQFAFDDENMGEGIQLLMKIETLTSHKLQYIRSESS